jgi:hypothetical protein
MFAMREKTKPQRATRSDQQADAAAAAAEPLVPDAVSAEEGAVPRARRVPFGTQVQKLAYAQRAGFHRHWFNDVPDRIRRAKEAGYEHVLGHDGKPVKRVVGVREGGGGMEAYLMEIPQEWFEEDQAAKQQVVDQSDDALKHGAIAGQPGVDGRYVKKIDIRTGR